METKILIVDDETAIGEMVCDILGEYGFETSLAETQAEAEAAMAKFRPAIALVDYQLGKVNGLDLARRLKALDPDLPVILMTAYPTLELAVKAINENIYDFISKPIDRVFLARSVAKAIENRSLIEENKRLVRNLQESNLSLERANKMKSKFLSIVTHDLRTPLTSARGFCDMLMTEPNLTEAEEKKYLSMVDTSITRMNNLVGTLMDFVSIESGKLRIDHERFDFAAILRELESTLAPNAKNKKIELSWAIAPGEIRVTGDSDRLHQVATNLISNSLKHTPEGGKVRVKVRLEGGKVVTEVEDNGEGISDADQDRIFDPFFQVESSPHKREGLGLGLAIAKEIVSAHGGEIGAKSPGPGKGSTFYFTLPISQS